MTGGAPSGRGDAFGSAINAASVYPAEGLRVMPPDVPVVGRVAGNRRGWFARIDRVVLLTGGIVVIALVLVMAALGQAKEIAIPTFLAAIGAIALAPPARWLEREGRAEATDPREPFRSAFVDKGWPRSPNFRFPSPPVTDRRRGRRVSC